MSFRLLGIVLGCVLGLASRDAASATSIEQLLVLAEKQRSSRPDVLESALAQLDARQEAASTEQRARIVLLHAYSDAFQGRYHDAVARLQPLADLQRDDGIRLRAALLLVNSAAVDRQFSLALKYLELALDLVNTRSYPGELRQNAFYAAALLYGQLEKHDLEHRYAQQMLAEPGSPRSRCAGQQIRLEALAGLKRYPAQRVFDEAIRACESIGEPVFANLIRTYLARKFADGGRPVEAADLLLAHADKIDDTRFPILVAQTHSLIAQFLVEARSDVAQKHAHKVVELTNVVPFSGPRVDALRVLYRIARAQRDFEQALRYHEAYGEASQTFLSDAKARELAFQQSRNELQQKNFDIALLSRQNEVLRLEQQVAKTSTQNTQLLIALLALLLTGGVIWAVRARRTHDSLRHLADTDGLTGISNRRHFRAQAEAAFAQCRQRGQAVAMLLFDLDHFKQINDRHGHGTGDWVLQEVARCCAAKCRKGDLFGRMGGEEFALALLDCDLATAREIAESLRHCIESIDPSPTGQGFRVSASFGCAGSAHSGHVYEALCANADAALYRAKHAGRNCVDVHADAPAPAAEAACTELLEEAAEA